VGATTPANWRGEGTGRPRRRDDGPAAAASRVALAWGFLTHPSLMPTVFARAEQAPDGESDEEGKVVARKV
jgi:hypothetical protein